MPKVYIIEMGMFRALMRMHSPDDVRWHNGFGGAKKQSRATHLPAAPRPNHTCESATLSRNALHCLRAQLVPR